MGYSVCLEAVSGGREGCRHQLQVMTRGLRPVVEMRTYVETVGN